MPKQYEAIRDKMESQGMPAKQAKTHAAKIYNSQHPKTPVGPHSDEHIKKLAHALKKR
jgi:hypothetical protein